MHIGKNIREAREAQGLLVSEVARRAGLTISGITSIESGRVRSPGIETVVQIARALGVDPGELLQEKADPKVVALPSTPLIDTSPEDLDERLKEAGSAVAVDAMLDAIQEEERTLEEFTPRYLAPKLDRARLYRLAIIDRWVKLADEKRDPRSNRFKSVSEIAREVIASQEELETLAKRAKEDRQKAQGTDPAEAS